MGYLGLHVAEMKTVINTAEYGTECWTCNFEGYNIDGSLFSAEYDLHRTLFFGEQKLASDKIYDVIQKQKHECAENSKQTAEQLKHLENSRNSCSSVRTCDHEAESTNEAGFTIKDGVPVKTCSHRGCPQSSYNGFPHDSCQGVFDWTINDENNNFETSENDRSEQWEKDENETDESDSIFSFGKQDVDDSPKNKPENVFFKHIGNKDKLKYDVMKEAEDSVTFCNDNSYNKKEHGCIKSGSKAKSERRNSLKLNLDLVEKKKQKFFKDKSRSSGNMLSSPRTATKPAITPNVEIEPAAQIVEARPRSHHFLW